LRATPLPAFDSGFHGPVAIIVRFSYNERPAASDMSDEHESFIKTPKQLVWIIFLAFAVPIAIIVLLITYVGSTTTQAIGSDNMTPEAIEARIKPVAGFELGSGGPASAEPRSGEAVYTAQCAACHAAGVAGAPKMGDAGAWADRLKQGLEALVQAAVKGKGAMPPQGGTASEFEIARAVVHMANASGGNFEEPAAPAAGESPAQAAAAPAAASAPQAAAPAAAPAEKAEKPAEAAPADKTAQAGGSDVDLAKGKQVYESTCAACHAAGVANAPKLGDKERWAPLIAEGMDKMVQIAIQGKGAMPPKGGRVDLPDEDIRATVAYMVSQSQ
jgi:cytochrome c5